MSTLTRRVGMLEGAVRQKLTRQFGVAVVRLRQTMAPEHARQVGVWLREHVIGAQRGNHTGDPNHACRSCIDERDPPALVRAFWILLFEHLWRGAPVALPPEIAQIYRDHHDVAPVIACTVCGYLLPTRNGQLAYDRPCPVCSRVGKEGP